jgi:hypothetical protein
MPNTTMPSLATVGRTAATYAKDLSERVIWTFLAAAASVALAAGPADMLHASFWHGAGAAGLAAAVSLVKGLAAKVIGQKNSASSAPGV